MRQNVARVESCKTGDRPRLARVYDEQLTRMSRAQSGGGAV